MAEYKTYKIEEFGDPVFTSRSSEIFPFEGDEKLVKVFRPEIMGQDIIDQEEINTTETFEKGVSAIECFGQIRVEYPDGSVRSGIVEKKIPGETLIDRVTKKPLSYFAAPKIMSDLMVQMHNAHTDKIRNYKVLVQDVLDHSASLQFLTEEERAEIDKRMAALPDGDSILHLDYHPNNILSDGKHVSIIDWTTAAAGNPAADVAMTLFLLNEGEMIPGLSPMLSKVLEVIRKDVCKKWYKLYKKKTGMTDDDVAPWRLGALIVRLGVWEIESEIPYIQNEIRKVLGTA